MIFFDNTDFKVLFFFLFFFGGGGGGVGAREIEGWGWGRRGVFFSLKNGGR